MRHASLSSLCLVLAITGCVGTLDTERDAGVDGDTSPNDADLTTSCDNIICPSGEVCVLGTCEPRNACHEIVCENPGDVCIEGVCVVGGADADGDGHTAAVDCDDWDAEVHPEAEELCDGRDNDCNSEIDDGFDVDGDGYTVCGGTDPTLADCDDTNETVHPGAMESCNGLDNDCDGSADDDAEGVGASCGSDVGDCSPGTMACVDGSLTCQGAQGPRTEACDGSDRDCDGMQLCADRDCDGGTCSGGGLCFGGVCALPCDTHNDGSVSCSTLCAWCRGSCRGAVTDGGSIVSCSHSGDEMWCYCQF
jgi:hypothetical protein